MNAEQAKNLNALRSYAATRLSALAYEGDKFSLKRKSGCIISQAYYDRALPDAVLRNMDKTKESTGCPPVVFSRADYVLDQAYGEGAFKYFESLPSSHLKAIDGIDKALKDNGFPYGVARNLRDLITPRKIAVLILLATIAYFAKMLIIGFLIGTYICGALVNNRWNPVSQIKAYYNLFRYI